MVTIEHEKLIFFYLPRHQHLQAQRQLYVLSFLFTFSLPMICFCDFYLQNKEYPPAAVALVLTVGST